MSDVNPYAPPPPVEDKFGGYSGYSSWENTGVWRQGNLLVMAKNATLPPRCVKNNEPTAGRLKRNLTWTPQWLILLFLCVGPIPYIIVALILQKTAKIEIGLSEEWRGRRNRAMMIAWLIALAAIGMFVGGVAFFEQTAGVLLIAGVFTILGALIYGTTAARMVSPKCIDDHFAWIKGVCPAYLDTLPEWTGPQR
jgi:hypothetical protein